MMIMMIIGSTGRSTTRMMMIASSLTVLLLLTASYIIIISPSPCHAFVLHPSAEKSTPVLTRQKNNINNNKIIGDLQPHLRRSSSSSSSSLNLALLSYDSWVSALQQVQEVVPDDGLSFTEKWSALAHMIDQLSPFNPELPLLSRLVLLGPLPLAFTAHMYTLSFPRQGYRDGLEPYPRGKYDPDIARSYYRNHPRAVIQRFLEIMRLSNHWLFGLLLDKYVFRNEVQMRQQRADELLKVMTQLGPTAVKVGQALSVRSDLLPEEYILALQTLQDQVPAFDDAQAKQIIAQQLGLSKCKELEGINEAHGPIASASIGQVYKARVRRRDVDVYTDRDDDDDSQNYIEVAVKVQRPNVLSEIALDLYLVRELAPFYQKYIARVETDLQSLANEWGRGFIAELDYREEAKKTMEFNKAMKERNLNAVTAPIVLPEYSSERILVTEWVDGTRIDRSAAGDIPRLCSVALNAYLVMLLDLGVSTNPKILCVQKLEAFSCCVSYPFALLSSMPLFFYSVVTLRSSSR
jgi:ABC1 atypical kinase-like domain